MSLLSSLNFLIDHPLNKDKKIGSIIRFVKWQIGSRLLPGGIVYEWVNNAKFIVKRGETGLTGNLYAGLHEFPDMAYLLHVLRSEDMFVDVGANMGSYSILACAVVGAKGIAFEPVPSTFSRLVENIKINCIDNDCKCINKGIGSTVGSLTFTSGSDTTNHVLAEEEVCDDVITVEIISLDDALLDQSPSVLKIDVEGFETPVLEGAKAVLKHPQLHSVILELNGSGSRYGFDESHILKLMLDNNFKTYSYDPFHRELTDLKGKNKTSGNTLFIRDINVVQEKLKTAPSFSIHGHNI